MAKSGMSKSMIIEFAARLTRALVFFMLASNFDNVCDLIVKPLEFFYSFLAELLDLHRLHSALNCQQCGLGIQEHGLLHHKGDRVVRFIDCVEFRVQLCNLIGS
jgi:hypothetical protein